MNTSGDCNKRPRIRKVFHFLFGMRPQTEPFHLMHYLCLASCREVNRPERIIFHYEQEPWGPYWDRIQPYLEMRKLSTISFVRHYRYTDPLVAKYRYAHVSDFARLEILLEQGGVYADMDTLFVRPIPDALYENAFVMGRERADTMADSGAALSGPSSGYQAGSLCNALIMSSAGAEFGARWLAEMEKEFDGSWSRHSTFLPYRLSQEIPNAIHVEPESSFFQLDWTPSGVADLFERRRRDLENAYSFHLWAHLWWERSRGEVSWFHGGLLTPAYIRHAKTTYAESARRFLPPEVDGSRAELWRERLTDLPITAIRVTRNRVKARLSRRQLSAQ